MSGKVAKKLAFGFEPMGEQKVKNISEPIYSDPSIVDSEVADLAKAGLPEK